MRENDVAPPDPAESQPALMMPRRQFLLVGSAAVLGVAATGYPSELIRTAAGQAGELSLLSVAHTDKLLAKNRAAAAGTRLVRPTGGLDARFVRDGARVTVHGFWRSARWAAEPLSLGVTALFPLGEEKTPFHAWAVCASGEAVHGSNPITFHIPVAARQPLEIRVDSRAPLGARQTSRRLTDILRVASAGEPKVATCSLGPGGVAPLRRGTYFIALGEARQKAPRWSSIHVADLTADGALALSGPGPLGRVDFDYLMISIDHA